MYEIINDKPLNAELAELFAQESLYFENLIFFDNWSHKLEDK